MNEDMICNEPFFEDYDIPQEPLQVELLPEQKGGKKSTLLICTILAVALSLIGGYVSGYFTVRQYHQTSAAVIETIPQAEPEPVSALPMNESAQSNTELTAAQVYAANVNSTVGITTSVSTNYWGYRTTSAASGSGFLISEDGYIVTNYHVIEDARSITVSLYDGSSYSAELVGYDESNDIAVLKINAQGLSYVTLGDSDSVHVGDSVVAIGNPLGELTFSLTGGLVSAVNREITLSNSLTMNLLQTDCAINSGNSGGPLFNMSGEVIGVTNAKYSSSGSEASIDNIGFAIPVNSIRSIVESIVEKGYLSKPYIGVSILNVTELTAQDDVSSGILVQAVSDGSPAASAGVLAGDVIISVDGMNLDCDAFVDRIASSASGESLTLGIYRQGQALEITLTVGEQIQSQAPQVSTAPALSEDPELLPRNRKSGTVPSGKAH